MAKISGRHLALVSAFIAGLAAGTIAVYGQGAVAPTPFPRRVLSGADLGFRVEGMRRDTPVGTLVIKVDGIWVEADFAGGGVKRLTK